MLTLAAEDVELALSPEVGGSVAAFRWRGAEVFRSAKPGETDPLGMASFPLVPWSNRIRYGRFRWAGRDIQLPLNFGDHPHAIHGHGWQSPWTVAEVRGDRAVLAFDYPGAAWPWRYRAVQTFALTADGFEVTLAVTNRSDSEMPCGLGHHPYYDRDADMTLGASLDGMWETDAEIMPTALQSVPRRDDWTGVLHGDATTDNVFTGWDGRAVVGFPSRGFAVEMTADAGWMVVYAPTHEAIACIEPVTHPTDPFNDPAHAGLRVLAPGKTLTLTTRFRVSATASPA